MRWWDWLRRKIAPTPSVHSATADETGEDAEQAKLKARQNLALVQRQGREAGSVSRSLNRLRTENHFGEAIERTMLTRRGH